MFYPLTLLLIGCGLVRAQGPMCGTPAPDPMKNCVSIRLPWQMEPVYFCIEKEKFRFRNHCFAGGQPHCGTDYMHRNGTLVVATPWDCCPHVSYPSPCSDDMCPPPPLNRKCVPVDGPGCCPSHFCEETVTPEQGCQGKRLEPMCLNPPQGKMKCVGFHDPFGCCVKYQCEGEGKPGLCPAQNAALQLQMRYTSSHQHMMNMSKPSRRNYKSFPSLSRFLPSKMGHAECIGDPNCPGNMKCCSMDVMAYGGADGHAYKRNIVSHGYCIDPIMMTPINPPPS